MIKKLFFSILLICISLVVVSLNVLFLTSLGLDGCIKIVDRLIPGSLTVENVQGRLARNFEIKGIRYTGSFGSASLERLALSWSPLSLLEKKFDINSVIIQNISVITVLQKGSQNRQSNSTARAFHLPLELNIAQGSFEKITVRNQQEATLVDEVSLTLEKFAADMNKIRAERISIHSEMYDISAKGEVLPTKGFPARLELEYAYRNNEIGLFAGAGTVEGTVQDLVVSSHVSSPFTGRIEGKIIDLFDNLHWQADISGEHICLQDINDAWPELSLQDLQVVARGGTQSYAAEIFAISEYESLQDVTLSATLLGDFGSLQVSDVNLEKDTASVKAKGRLNWETGFSWQADIIGTNLDPMLVNEQWPGSIDIVAGVSGKLQNNTLATDIELQSLQGKLRGYPVSGKGRVTVNDNAFTVTQLHIQSGDSNINLTGSVNENLGLRFRASSSDLAEVWPGSKGSISGKGSITGKIYSPEFDFELTGESLGFREVEAGSLHAAGSGVWGSDGRWDTTVSANKLLVDDTVLDELVISLHGSQINHSFSAMVDSNDLSLELEGKGTYSQGKWQGSIGKLSTTIGKRGEWDIQKPVKVTYEKQNISIASLCLAGREKALICSQGNYIDQKWQADIQIDNFPVELLQNRQKIFEGVSGRVSASLDLSGEGSKLMAGNIDLTADNLFFDQALAETYTPVFRWQKVRLKGVAINQQLDMQLSGIMVDGSNMTGAIQLQDFSLMPLVWEQSTVAGEIDFSFFDLTPLSSLSYPVVEPSGRMTGSMKVHGKVIQPQINGKLSLSSGRLNFPEQGVALEELTADIKTVGNNLLQIELSGSSGGGRLQAKGQLDFGKAARERLTLKIAGNNVEVLNVPEMKVRMSPELQITATRDQFTVKGDVLVTDALFAFQELKRGIAPSGDVVIIDENEEEETTLPFEMQVSLVAGEMVRIRAFGLKGFIDGRLQIIAVPDRPVVFEGNLDIRNGTYSIYGRQLNIVRGQLSYHGSPPDNPGIKVRAENTASGVITGIEVSGFLKEPKVGFYSTPPMEENEIIKRLLVNTSLLGSEDEEGLFGSVASDRGADSLMGTVQDVKKSLKVDDIKLESGKESDDLSLVIGSWITPKLYISYGKNLLKESGSFNTKYLLGKGFSVETESGSTDSGVDLMYEIDSY